MTERPPVDSEGKSQNEVDRALIDELRSELLDPSVLARIHAAVEREWQASVIVQRRSVRSRRWRWASMAAAVSLAVVTTAWFVGSSVTPVVLGTIARVVGPESTVRFALVRDHTLRVGDALRSGDTLTTQSATLVALRAGGTLRIAADTVIHVISATEIRLEHGMIYVDKPPTTVRSDHLRVATLIGTIEHVGTQFEVRSRQQAVRVRVREGKVRLHNMFREVIAEAGTELLAAPGGAVSERHVAPYDADWQWVATLAPDYVIEGQPLLGFLQWVSRELGRHLEFATPQVRDLAARTIMHGTVQSHAPMEALANVLAATSLKYEIRGDTIWVQSGP